MLGSKIHPALQKGATKHLQRGLVPGCAPLSSSEVEHEPTLQLTLCRAESSQGAAFHRSSEIQPLGYLALLSPSDHPLFPQPDNRKLEYCKSLEIAMGTHTVYKVWVLTLVPGSTTRAKIILLSRTVESDWFRFQRISRHHLKFNPRQDYIIVYPVEFWTCLWMEITQPFLSNLSLAPVAGCHHFEIWPSPLTFKCNFSCSSLYLVSSALLLYPSRSLHLLYKIPLRNWKQQWDPPLSLSLEETQLSHSLSYCAPDP